MFYLIAILAGITTLVTGIAEDRSMFLLSAAIWVGMWLIARHSSNAYSLNGCGTMFYDSASTEVGTTTTKWITIFSFPVLPVRSYLRPSLAMCQHLGINYSGGYGSAFTALPLRGIGIVWKDAALTWCKGVGIAALVLAFGFVAIGIISALSAAHCPTFLVVIIIIALKLSLFGLICWLSDR